MKVFITFYMKILTQFHKFCLNLNKRQEGMWYTQFLIPAPGRWRQADFCVFEASLIYIGHLGLHGKKETSVLVLVYI